VINSASDEGMHKDHSSVMGKGAHNNTQLTELVVAASRYQIDIYFIGCDPTTLAELILRKTVCCKVIPLPFFDIQTV